MESGFIEGEHQEIKWKAEVLIMRWEIVLLNNSQSEKDSLVPYTPIKEGWLNKETVWSS